MPKDTLKKILVGAFTAVHMAAPVPQLALKAQDYFLTGSGAPKTVSVSTAFSFLEGKMNELAGAATAR